MSEHNANDLIDYAHDLASGQADQMVRRLGEYVDWDEGILQSALDSQHSREHGYYSGWSNGTEKGIYMALVKARATAADYAYKRRHPRRRRSA